MDEALIEGHRFQRVYRDCLAAHFTDADAVRFAARIMRDMPGLAGAEINLDPLMNMAEDCSSGRRPAIPRVVCTSEGLRGAR
jgi:hypothetical protein